MKRTRIVFSAAFLVFSQLAHSQDTTKAGTIEEHQDDIEAQSATHANRHRYLGPSAGIELGVTDASLIFGGKAGASIVGPRFGAFVYGRIAGAFCVQPGIALTWTGGTELNDDNTQLAKYSVRTLEVPVYLGFRYGHKRSKIISFIGIGPYAGLNFGGTVTAPGEASRAIEIGSTATDDIRLFDYGVGLIESEEWPFGLFFRLRAQVGLANLAPVPGNDNPSVYSYSFGLQIGYLLGAKHPKHRPYSAQNLTDPKM